MPNTFAYVALMLWPFIAMVLYKKLPIVNATFWTIVGGFLLLPAKTEVDFPLIPPLDKESIPIIAALIGCRYIKKVNIRLVPKEGLERWLILGLLIMPMFTMLNNQESYNFIPGLTLHDGFSSVLSMYIYILPFIIGMHIIKEHKDQLELFKLLLVAGLFYSILILYEIRLSPQLHSSIYGFFPHSFGQQKRFGGFRPVVFLGHGLIVAMFVAMMLSAATVLIKEKVKIFGFHPTIILIYLMVLLFLCKTVGAFLIGLLVFVAITFMSIKMIKRLTQIIILLVLMYPLLSILEYFPHSQLVQLASDFDPARGESLAYRFYHESRLLEHAQEKLYFGWGGWRRNRVENSVTDGYWIIVFGKFGLVGFATLFGLLSLSVWRAIKVSALLENKNKNKKEAKLLIYHSLIVSVVLIDQLPNDSLAAWLLFLIGALLGRANNLRVKDSVIKVQKINS